MDDFPLFDFDLIYGDPDTPMYPPMKQDHGADPHDDRELFEKPKE